MSFSCCWTRPCRTGRVSPSLQYRSLKQTHINQSSLHRMLLLDSGIFLIRLYFGPISFNNFRRSLENICVCESAPPDLLVMMMEIPHQLMTMTLMIRLRRSLKSSRYGWIQTIQQALLLLRLLPTSVPSVARTNANDPQ